MGGTRHPLVGGCQVALGSIYDLQLALLKATHASMTLTVSSIAAFQCFALGKPTRGQAEQNSGLPGSGELKLQFHQYYARDCATLWQLTEVWSLQIVAVKISLAFGHIPLLRVSRFLYASSQRDLTNYCVGGRSWYYSCHHRLLYIVTRIIWAGPQKVFIQVMS